MPDHDVTEDDALTPDEKQLSFITTKADAPAVRFHSEVASVTRALLNHPHATVEEERTNSEGEVTAVTGTIPIGCLTVKASPKKSAQFNTLVSSGVKPDG